MVGVGGELDTETRRAESIGEVIYPCGFDNVILQCYFTDITMLFYRIIMLLQPKVAYYYVFGKWVSGRPAERFLGTLLGTLSGWWVSGVSWKLKLGGST